MTERDTEVLAAAARLAAAGHRRAEIESSEIVYVCESVPALRTGADLDTLEKMVRLKMLMPQHRLRRELKHPERGDQLRAEIVRLEEMILHDERILREVQRG